MRILLDTNIWVSAFLSPEGNCGRLIHQLLSDGDIEIVTSASILDEIVDVLARPRLTRRYSFTPDEVKQFVAWIWAAAQIVIPLADSYGCRDRDDDIVCAAAVAGRARYLVTRDDDLKRDPALMQTLGALGLEVITVSGLERLVGLIVG